jgi:hypothetical protein
MSDQSHWFQPPQAIKCGTAYALLSNHPLRKGANACGFASRLSATHDIW